MNQLPLAPHTLHPIGAFGLIEQRCHHYGWRGDVCVTDDFGNLVSVNIYAAMLNFRD